MQIKNLYRYEEADGSVTVTLTARAFGERRHGVRLIADENKILVKDGYETCCIDTDSPDGWTEIDAPEEITERKTINGNE